MSIRDRIQKVTATLLLVFAFAVPAVMITGDSAVYAVGAAQKTQVCNGIAAAGGNCSEGTTGVTDLFKNVSNILLFVIGAISVIMIIVGGLRYVTSAGDQSQVSNAKNTILYAVVGLVIASAAFAIVNFVIGKI